MSEQQFSSNPPATARVRVAVVGASGYSGEELVRLLMAHPAVELVAVTSRQYAGQTVAAIFPRFASHPVARALRFVEPNVELLAKQAQVVFLALPHGVSAEFAVPLLTRGCQVIDLSADFRLRSAAVYQEFYGHEHPAPAWLEKAVYGSPEIRRDAIRAAQLVAAPGCYPTSILLPLVPLLRAGLIEPTEIIASSLSGVTGAGRKAEVDYLFAECNESLRAYGIPKHRHLSEIEQELALAAGGPVTIQFTPHLVPVNRGILTTVYCQPRLESRGSDAATAAAQAVGSCLLSAYAREPFVRLLEGRALPDTKNVVATNFLEIAWRVDPRTGRLLLLSAEDNIVKGASGQAVQCLNLMCGFPETLGLL
jgi:N-acetyl-gamma-glutamyl-phosphate reductase